jgi:hypothetical protein
MSASTGKSTLDQPRITLKVGGKIKAVRDIKVEPKPPSHKWNAHGGNPWRVYVQMRAKGAGIATRGNMPVFHSELEQLARRLVSRRFLFLSAWGGPMLPNRGLITPRNAIMGRMNA